MFSQGLTRAGVEAARASRRSAGRFARAVLVMLGGAAIGVVPNVAAAQIFGTGTDRSYPTGSPLGNGQSNGSTNGSNTGNQTGSSTIDPTGSSVAVQPADVGDEDSATGNDRSTEQSRSSSQLIDVNNPRLKPPAEPGEFELYVSNAIGRKLPRFGADLLLPSNRDYAVPSTSTIPPDYILNVGDTIAIALTGSIEGSFNREINTDGRITLPRVGSIMVAGRRYGDLRDLISRAVGTQYRGYTVTVNVTELRGIRVYVTGFANNPGAYTVNSLSTMVNAVLAAGGPAAGGSFRSIKLYRAGREVTDFDLYDLIRRGDRSRDAVLQNEDVLFIPPVGEQVAVVGSVNQEAIYEARPGESLQSVLAFAGGLNSLADPGRIMLYRVADPTKVIGQQVLIGQAGSVPVRGSDIIQALALGSLQRPLDRQTVLVRIEGEVNSPGNYVVAPNTPLSTVLSQAGGLTSQAFVFGTRLERVSTRNQQRESFLEAIDQFQITLAAAPLTSNQLGGGGADERLGQVNGARAVLERLRAAEPDGRVVLDLPPAATDLPGDLILENNDRIVIPPRLQTVGVFGAVYRPSSFLLGAGQPLRVRDYVNRAGGTLRAADTRDIFVVRANGEVLPRRRGAMSARVLPGDLIFVPVKTQSTSVLAKIRDIATIVGQVGLTAAALAVIAN